MFKNNVAVKQSVNTNTVCKPLILNVIRLCGNVEP